MITANEARRLAEEELYINVNVQLEVIEEQIRKAVNAGKFNISNSGYLSPHCKEKLEELGFKVETGMDHNEPWYCVKW